MQLIDSSGIFVNLNLEEQIIGTNGGRFGSKTSQTGKRAGYVWRSPIRQMRLF